MQKIAAERERVKKKILFEKKKYDDAYICNCHLTRRFISKMNIPMMTNATNEFHGY